MAVSYSTPLHNESRGIALGEYQRTTERPRRPSARRSGLARIREQFYVILAHSAGMLAVFRIQEDGTLSRLQSYPGTLHRALLWHVASGRHEDHMPDIPTLGHSE